MPGTPELPLHIAKDMSYGNQILSGTGKHLVSHIGPKYDGERVPLYVSDDGTYCSTFKNDQYVLLPEGVINIEKMGQEYYSNLYYDMSWKVGNDVVIVKGRDKSITWKDVMDSDKYDGFIITHFGSEYKLKKKMTFDLLITKDGLADSNKVLQHRQVRPENIGKIVECTIEINPGHEEPMFRFVRFRPDKQQPQSFSPYIIEADQFVPYEGKLYDGVTSQQFAMGVCCGGAGGDVHKVGCSNTSLKRVSTTPIDGYTYYNGMYVNFDPASYGIYTRHIYYHDYFKAMGYDRMVLILAGPHPVMTYETCFAIDYLCTRYPRGFSTDNAVIKEWMKMRHVPCRGPLRIGSQSIIVKDGKIVDVGPYAADLKPVYDKMLLYNTTHGHMFSDGARSCFKDPNSTVSIVKGKYVPSMFCLFGSVKNAPPFRDILKANVSYPALPALDVYDTTDPLLEKVPYKDKNNNYFPDRECQKYAFKKVANVHHFSQRYFKVSSVVVNKAFKGKNVYWDDSSINHMMTQKSWETFIKFIDKENISTSSVVDATASIGGMAIRFAQQGSNVVAYEKDDIRYGMLCKNTDLLSVKMTCLHKPFDYRIPLGSLVVIDPPLVGQGGSYISIENCHILDVVDRCVAAGAGAVFLNMPGDYRMNASALDDLKLIATTFDTGLVRWFVLRKVMI